MRERVVIQREIDTEKEGEGVLEAFVQISEEEECVNPSTAELCWLNWRQETFLSFQGLSKAALLLMHRTVWCHFLLPFCCSTFSLSPLPLPCGSTLHALDLHLQRSLLLPVCFLLWLSGLTSEAGIQHDTGLLPQSTRTSIFHVVGEPSLVDMTEHSRWAWIKFQTNSDRECTVWNSTVISRERGLQRLVDFL